MTLMTEDYSLVPTTLAMLTVISVIGSIGNGLVIIVFGRKRDKSTATLFIIILALNDCFTCVTIIPMTIYIESQSWIISNNVLCRLYYFLNNGSIPFSAFLISLIAVDRYICICHPFSKVMTLSRSKVSIAVVLTISLLIGTASNFQVKMIVQVKPKGDMSWNTTETVESTECVDFSRIVNASLSERIFFNIVQKSQLFSYTLSIAIVICLYVAIYFAVLRSRKRKKELKGFNHNKRPTYSWETQEIMICHERNSLVKSSLEADSFRIQSKKSIPTAEKSPPSYKGFLAVPGMEVRRVSLRSICETDAFQNLRTAAMLFVVAISYIISFLPAFLMVNQLVNFNLPLFYMYYINNAANPIIYCFMNSNFRQDIREFSASFK